MHRASKSMEDTSSSLGWPFGLRSAAIRVGSQLNDELTYSTFKREHGRKNDGCETEQAGRWREPYPRMKEQGCDSLSSNFRVQSQHGLCSKSCREQQCSCTLTSASPRSSNGESDVSSVGSEENSPLKENNNSSLRGNTIRPLASLRSIVQGQPMGAWDTAWKEGIIPWDIGAVTPFVKELIGTGLLASMRILVPGCGSGYDVLALASSAKEVVGLDISDTAIERATTLRDACRNPCIRLAKFVAGDFFSYEPAEAFDLIFDYTFFCALEPALRKDWARCISRLLSPKGQLITIVYPISEHKGGPPYAVTPDTYKEVLELVGFEATLLVPNLNSFPSRQGKEVVGHWRRRSIKSEL